MEPFAMASGFVLQASAELLRQKFGEGAVAVTFALYRRMREGGAPVNHDLQRAVRRAYLKATYITCNACLEDLGVPPRRWRRAAGILYQRSKDVRDLDVLRRAIRDQIREASKAPYAPPTNGTDDEMHLLLQPGGATTDRVRALGERLKEHVVQELPTWHPGVPERLVQLIQEGWLQKLADGKEETQDWFDWMCACFLDELKHDDKVERVFNSQLLAKLQDGGAEVQFRELEVSWRRWGGTALDRLEQVDRNLAQLRSEQSAELGEMQEQLDDLRATMASLPALAMGQTEAVALLRQLLAELRRPSLLDRYAGGVIAEQVDQVVEAAGEGDFVGRGSEIDRLNRFVEDGSTGRMVVTGRAGFGKTALLANWLRQRRSATYVAYHFFSVGRAETRSQANAWLNLFRQLYDYYGLDAEGQEVPQDGTRLGDVIHGLVGERGAPNGRLVILLDGLDEAEEVVRSSLLPRTLPPGVRVVVSARAEEHEEPDYLDDWANDAERMHLDRLQPAAVVEWLRGAMDGALAPLADDEGFVAEFDQKTQGFPLYVHHLGEELARSSGPDSDTDPTEVLTRTPEGFTQYVMGQLQVVLSLPDVPKSLLEFFAVLSVAKGRLHQWELEELTAMDDQDFAQLRGRWKVTRWFHITGHGADVVYSFSQLLLAETFAKAMRKRSQAAAAKLLDWCGRWREREFPGDYALRHYADHLFDAVPERREQQDVELPEELAAVYALARDPAFAAAQVARLPAEPDLPLRPLQAAIRAAAKADHAAGMAEFVLVHLGRLTTAMRQWSALAALDEAGMARAWSVADSFAAEQRTLWYLMLAWSTRDAGRLGEARQTLERLLQQPLQRLTGWHSDMAAWLLVHLLDVDPDRLTSLLDRVLDDVGAYLVCREMASEVERVRADPDAPVPQAALRMARHAVDGIESAWRVPALAFLVEGQARTGDVAAARSSLHAIEAALPSTTPPWAAPWVAKAQAEVGDFDAAVRAAQLVEDADERTTTLVAVARIQAARDREGAAATLRAAEKAAKEIGQAQAWAYQRASGRDIWAKLSAHGASAGSRSSFAAALEEVGGWTDDLLTRASDYEDALRAVQDEADSLDDARRRAALLAAIGMAWARRERTEQAADTLASARTVAQEIQDVAARDDATGEIAQLQAAARQVEAALDTVGLITDPEIRASVLLAIGTAQLDAGLAQPAATTLSTAFQSAMQITDDVERADVLAAIAQVQARHGVLEIGTAFEPAWEAAKRIKDPGARTGALARMVAAYEQAGQGAAATFDLVLRAAAEIEDAIERAFLLGVLAKTLVQADAAKLADRAVQAARSVAEGVHDATERAVLLGGIGQRLTEAGASELAAPVFEAARQAAKATPEPDWPLHVALVSLPQAEDGTFVAIDVVAGGVARTVEMILEGADPDVRSLALMILAEARARSGDVAHAASIFEATWEAVLAIPDPVDRTAAVAALVGAGAGPGEEHAGPTSRALDDLHRRRMTLPSLDAAAPEAPNDDPEQRAGFLSALAWLQAESAVARALTTFDAARRAAMTIEDAERRLYALADVGRTQALRGYSEESVRTLEAAVAAAGAIDDAAARARALRHVAMIQARMGGKAAAIAGFQAARAATMAITDAEAAALNLLVLARAQALVGDPDGAAATLDTAGQAAGAIADPAQRTVFLDATQHLWAWPTAGPDASTLELVRQGAFALRRVQALTTVALAREAVDPGAAAATIELADKDVQGIEDAGYKARGLAALAVAKARSNAPVAAADLEVAHRAAEELVDPSRKAIALATVGVTEAETGDADGARRTLGAALEAATATGPEAQKDALLAVVDGQLAVGDLPAALRTCLQLERLGGEPVTREVQLRIARALAASGATAAARETLAVPLGRAVQGDDQQRERLQAWCLAGIGRLQAEAGAFAEARTTAGWIEDEGVRASMLVDIAEAETARSARAGGAAALPTVLLDAGASTGQEALGSKPAGEGETGGSGIEAARSAARARRVEQAALRTTGWLGTDRSRSLLEDAGRLAPRDRDNFERLLVPCAHYPEAAYGICQLLALAYPAQAGEVAAAVKRFG